MALDDKSIGVQEWITVLGIREFTFLDWSALVAQLLLDAKVCFFNDQTVGWNLIARIQKHDITDHKVPHLNFLSRTKLPSDDCHRLLLD